MNLYVKNGSVLRNGIFRRVNLLVEKGKISSFDGAGENAFLLDGAGMRVVPGFLDAHTHGGNGIDVNAATKEDYQKIGRFFASQSTTGYLCSILSDSEDHTLWCIEQAVAAMEDDPQGARLLGIHLEGPFLCRDYKGAMPEQMLRKADPELFLKYQKAAGGRIRYVTVSPEVEGVPELIPVIRKTGAAVAIGHSGADYDTAMECIRAGANSATHTFNAMKLMHQHFPAISGAVLESDVYCEAICDGRHLHPGTVRILLKAKGLDRVIAVTDSIMAAGLPDGGYQLGVNDIVVKNGDAMLADGSSRAGSTLTTGTALKNLSRFTERPLEELIPLLTSNPARMLGLNGKGSLETGMDADFVLLDGDLNVAATVVGGKLVYQRKDDVQ